MADERPDFAAMTVALDRAAAAAKRFDEQWRPFQEAAAAILAAQDTLQVLKRSDAIRAGHAKEVAALKEQKLTLGREIEAWESGLQDFKRMAESKRQEADRLDTELQSRRAREAAEIAEHQAKVDALKREYAAVLEKLKPPSLRQAVTAAK